MAMRIFAIRSYGTSTAAKLSVQTIQNAILQFSSFFQIVLALGFFNLFVDVFDLLTQFGQSVHIFLFILPLGRAGCEFAL